MLGACCEKWDMDADTAYRLGAFFGGGMRRGQVCGALTGALMALGMEYGDENNRKSTKSIEMMKAFQQEFGSVLCKELLGEDGKKKKELCPVLIKFCADSLEMEVSE